ncbi:MAG TPA: sensor histidine kinase [Puia sp.]|nr:sensor histidine kinase [Puia sp.]
MPYSVFTFGKLYPQICTWLLALFFIPAIGCLAQSTSLADSFSCSISNKNVKEFISGIRLSNIQFTKAANNRINLGNTSDQYGYVLFKLSTDSMPILQYLTIDNTSLDTISIFRIYDAGTSRLLYFGGTLVPYDNKRNYVWHTAPVEITNRPVFLLVAMKAVAKNINISYYLLNKSDLDKKNRSLDRLVFFYIGAISLIAVIILATFFLFKKPSVAAYFGYIICFSGWIVCHYGYLFPLVYPYLPEINEIAKPVFSFGSCFFLITVFRILFKKNLHSRHWLYYPLNIISFILPVLTVSMLLFLIPGIGIQVRAVLIIVWQLGVLMILPFIIVTPACFYNSGTTAKIFSLAALVTCIMAIAQFLSNFGFINNYFMNEHGMTLASLVEIFIMAFGLFYNLLEEKQTKERLVFQLEQENSETLKRLITVQDNERKRIAGDLHDNIGPLLSALKINFRRIVHEKEDNRKNELSAKTEVIIDDSIAEIRNIAHNLMPKGLSSKGLINTLADYFESIRQLYNKDIVFHHEVQFIAQPDLQINLYRIICELILNAVKHSNARSISVCIKADEKNITLSIQDDGQGFPAKPDGLVRTLGLQNVEGRVWYLKGKFDLESLPGKGTAIHIKIPSHKD